MGRASRARVLAAALVAAAAGAVGGSAAARPGVVYATYAPEAQVLAIGKDGSAYVAGKYAPVTDGAFTSCTPNPGREFPPNGLDVYISKLDPSGSSLVWSACIGGPGRDDFASGIALDAAGNVYVTGTANSPLFPTTAGALDRTHAGTSDVFVAKLDPTGSQLLYSTFLGGTGSEEAGGLAVHPDGDAYVAGRTKSTNFPTTPGALSRRPLDKRLDRLSSDAFVAKLDPSGSRLVYSTLLGGDGSDAIRDIELDAAGNAYVTGDTDSKDFPVTPGAAQRRCGMCAHEKGGLNTDGFIAKLNPSGSRLDYATFVGGRYPDNPLDLAIDRQGNAYVAGSTVSPDFPVTRGAFDTSRIDNPGSSTFGFVVKLNATGTRLVYATYLGARCTCQALATGIAIDRAGTAWVTGWTGSKSFPTTPGAYRRSLPPSFIRVNAFLTEFDRSGSRLAYSTFLGHGTGSRVALDPRVSVYAAGMEPGRGFPTTPGVYGTFGNAVKFALVGFLVKFSPRS